MRRGVYGQMCQTFIDAWMRTAQEQTKPNWRQVTEIIGSSPIGEYVSVVSLASARRLHFSIYSAAWLHWGTPRFKQRWISSPPSRPPRHC